MSFFADREGKNSLLGIRATATALSRRKRLGSHFTKIEMLPF